MLPATVCARLDGPGTSGTPAGCGCLPCHQSFKWVLQYELRFPDARGQILYPLSLLP